MINLVYVTTFFLVFVRMLSFIFSCPLYAIPGIPPLVKAGLSLVLAALTAPLVEPAAASFPGGLWGLGLAVFSEVGVGLAIGLVCTFVFNAIRIAGQLLDFQIGFAMAAVMDPLGGGMNTLVSRFLFFMTLVLYMNMDGHHALIRALVKSYELVPLTAAAMNGELTLLIIRIFTDTFALAVQICAPVVAVLVITDLAMGLIGKTAPQLNIFQLGFPLKIAVGVSTLAILLPALTSVFKYLFDTLHKDLLLLLKGLA
ncbi:flagellar biosynthetic protein FliR [Desulforamulus reducens MI-1]|uniref:Flagellar biosynthetic protein FliR n=1 Tax=Desulforamulus reducens (strain ATCC BAA-1160 / DSM 100696 / MI-1) TaxID=349161 RepID=A4J751_DESRM|nr:flagellar biosynthetic protein FliR [Desulforamulus reducens]ABO50904.1 flagellar biosynthetic protein FliR [Desulforamulus reducens MI-1]